MCMRLTVFMLSRKISLWDFKGSLFLKAVSSEFDNLSSSPRHIIKHVDLQLIVMSDIDIDTIT